MIKYIFNTHSLHFRHFQTLAGKILKYTEKQFLDVCSAVEFNAIKFTRINVSRKYMFRASSERSLTLHVRKLSETNNFQSNNNIFSCF